MWWMHISDHGVCHQQLWPSPVGQPTNTSSKHNATISSPLKCCTTWHRHNVQITQHSLHTDLLVSADSQWQRSITYTSVCKAQRNSNISSIPTKWSNIADLHTSTTQTRLISRKSNLYPLQAFTWFCWNLVPHKFPLFTC